MSVNESGNLNLTDDLIYHPAVQAKFGVLYAVIFIVGLVGNILVCYVVCTNRAMQTVTNVFIANLALSDILLCVLAVPFTPLYFFLHKWIFGQLLCHLVAYSQGTSVYVSTFTLTSIAIDRFFVILYPFRPRMKMTTCIIVICSIWFFALCATLPYGIFVNLTEAYNVTYCEENWPSDLHRQIFGAVTTVMQFVVPFLIITFAYTKVSLKLQDRSREKAKIRLKGFRGEELDRERKRRTNRMLIAMVTIFGACWLPLNLVNLLNDLYYKLAWWKYYNLCFFLAHATAMSSTCYNVFLYAWLNDNFRKELKRILPCFGDKGAKPERNSGLLRASKKSNQEALILIPADPDVKQVPREEILNHETVELVSVHYNNKSPLDSSTCPQCSAVSTTTFVAFDELISPRHVELSPVASHDETTCHGDQL